MANRPDDEELMLRHYGEHPTPEEIERVLAADPELAARAARLAADLAHLDAIDAPEPRPGLEGRIWARVAPELERSRRPSHFLPWRLGALAATLLVAVVGAFLAGRASNDALRPPLEVELAALPIEARERILVSALENHLESSERLLVELANDAPPAIEDERRFAEALLTSNRLYRRAAERSGQRRVARLLAELEPLLAELAHAPGEGEAGVESARARLDARDLLFRVRVTRNNIPRSEL